MEKYKADVVVVGAGLAGLIATYELLNAGRKVLLIDRDTESNLGGLANWSFGGMLFVDTKHQRRMGIRDSIARAKEDWFSFAEFDKDEKWGKLWAEQYLSLCRDHGYTFLRNHNIKFFPILNFPERGLDVKGNSLPRFHMVWGTGWALTQEFVQRVKYHTQKSHLQIITDRRVQKILIQSGQVVGVSGVGEKEKVPFEAYGDQTIIATGGINGSIEKIKQHWYKPWGAPPETILNGAHQYAIGDLHDAAQQIRGNVVNLDKQWNYAVGIRHYAPRVKDHGLSLVPMKSTLWCNYEGKRIGPRPMMTPYDTRYLVERVCQQPIKYSWQILNAKIAYKEFSISGSEHNVAMRDKKLFQFLYGMLVKGSKAMVHRIAYQCEDVIMADDLDTLVSKMNALTGDNYVKKSHVQSAAMRYDAEIERGPRYFQDEQLLRIKQLRAYIGDRFRTCKFQKILEPDARPLIAIRSFILSRKSLGGIQTDLDCKVLTTPDHEGRQEPIRGLYAIGEAAGFGGGGMHGYRSLEGTFLGGCVITARVAAANICGYSLS